MADTVTKLKNEHNIRTVEEAQQAYLTEVISEGQFKELVGSFGAVPSNPLTREQPDHAFDRDIPDFAKPAPELVTTTKDVLKAVNERTKEKEKVAKDAPPVAVFGDTPLPVVFGDPATYPNLTAEYPHQKEAEKEKAAAEKAAEKEAKEFEKEVKAALKEESVDADSGRKAASKS